MRRLIINADDFGLTKGVNRAIAEAHQAGVVTSTTLMATGGAFGDAVSLARTLPGLGVGCHVVLVDGRPTLRPEQVPTLLKENKAGPHPPEHRGTARRVAAAYGDSPCFPDGFATIARKSFGKRLKTQEIEAEVTSQIHQLQQAGISVTHVDSHKHVHMVPAIADAILRAARACGVRAIRNPFVPLKTLAFAHLVRRPKLWTRYTEVKILKHFEDDFRRRVADAGMITTDGSFGVIVTGTLDPKLFRAIVGSIPDGTWEFVSHPGYNDQELDLVRTRLRASREKELSVLTSEEAREIIAQNEIELINYRDLAAHEPAH